MKDLIIKEFNRLLNYIQNNICGTSKERNAKKFRIMQLKNIINILDKQQTINKNNYEKLVNIDGIGINTIKRIKEIIDNGNLSEIKEDNNNIISNLKQIIGIGDSLACKLVDEGVKSIDDLKNKVENDEIKVNDQIKLGIKYYDVCKEDIPRSEIDLFNSMLEEILNNKYIYNICGSYRRGKKKSNDIDVLISIIKENKKNNLKIIIDKLKERNLLVDDMTTDFKTKYMGFIKIKNDIRRIDIRFVDYSCYYSALLYFTGSMEFNKNMRKIAKDKGYKLSEYGLFKDNNLIVVNSEKEIFDILEMDYKEPNER